MLIFIFAKHNFTEMFICDHSTSRVHCVRESMKEVDSAICLIKYEDIWLAWLTSPAGSFPHAVYASNPGTSCWLSTGGMPFSASAFSQAGWYFLHGFSLLCFANTSYLQNSTQRTTFPETFSDLCSRVLGCHGTCCFPRVPTEPHRHTSNSACIILSRDGLDFLAHLFIRPWGFQGRFSWPYMP